MIRLIKRGLVIGRVLVIGLAIGIGIWLMVFAMAGFLRFFLHCPAFMNWMIQGMKIILDI